MTILIYAGLCVAIVWLIDAFIEQNNKVNSAEKMFEAEEDV